MSRFRDGTVSETARAQARKLGMYGDVDGRLKKMARMAMRYTHPLANWRYQQYLLKIEGDVIQEIIKFTPDELAKYEKRSYRERRAGVAPGEPIPVTDEQLEKAREAMQRAKEEFGPGASSTLPLESTKVTKVRKK